MPVISVVLSDDDHLKLQDEYQNMAHDWPRLGHQLLPPTFEQWIAARALAGDAKPSQESELNEVRIFNAIETLIISLRQHGFDLAHMAKHGMPAATSAHSLAQAIVSEMGLRPLYTRRLQELFEHYLKSAKEIADAAHVGITNRAYGALSEAYRQLAERTANSAVQLGPERALGRVEGAAAILVSTQVMDRHSASRKTEAFKLQLRGTEKANWVERAFGGIGKKD